MTTIGVKTEVTRYVGNITPSILNIKVSDKIVGMTILNESTNYYLYIIKNSKNGLEADKLELAKILGPGMYFHLEYNYPYVITDCYDFRYIEVDDSDKLTDCDGNAYTPQKQFSIILEKMCQ